MTGSYFSIECHCSTFPMRSRPVKATLIPHLQCRTENPNCWCCFCCCRLLLMTAFYWKMKGTIRSSLCRTNFRKLKLLTPWKMHYLLPRQELGKMENDFLFFSNLDSFTVEPLRLLKKSVALNYWKWKWENLW